MIVYGMPNDRKTRKLIKSAESGNILAQAELVNLGIGNKNFPYVVTWLYKIINSKETDMQKWEDVRRIVHNSCLSPIRVCHGGIPHIVKHVEIEMLGNAIYSSSSPGHALELFNSRKDELAHTKTIQFIDVTRMRTNKSDHVENTDRGTADDAEWIKAVIQNFTKSTSDKVKFTVKYTLNDAARKIQRETKRVIVKLLKMWLVFLILIIVLFAIIGGLHAGAIFVISAIALLVFSIISVIAKTKIATSRIAMEIPMDIANRLLNEISKDSNFDPDMANEVRSKVLEIVKNPSLLIFSPNKTADTAKELSSAISSIVKA